MPSSFLLFHYNCDRLVLGVIWPADALGAATPAPDPDPADDILRLFAAALVTASLAACRLRAASNCVRVRPSPGFPLQAIDHLTIVLQLLLLILFVLMLLLLLLVAALRPGHAYYGRGHWFLCRRLFSCVCPNAWLPRQQLCTERKMCYKITANRIDCFLALLFSEESFNC